MNAADLEFASMLELVKPFTDKGRPRSIAFLNWFLEHIYRLDQVSAEDAICDKNNDRGIDGIYVDNEQLEIHVFQSKTKQNGTLGDKDVREFSGTLNQIRTKDAYDLFISGKVDQEIKDKLNKVNFGGLLESGYTVRGVFVTNAEFDANGRDMLANDPALIGFGRDEIAQVYVDLGEDAGIRGEYEFRADGKPLVHQAGQTSKVVVFFAEGKQLSELPGIADGSLFELNVRLPLGSTKVNKAIQDSLSAQAQHQKFALFHNGVTVLAEEVELDDERVRIKNFVVVNGAQSLKQFHSGAGRITGDLRVLTRIIEIGGDAELAREISINSNNQNGIKPRDLRSNDKLQVRLKSEFETINFEGYRFDVKRGAAGGDRVISNEAAGKLLLAFDLDEPWSCHQTYKLFDEKYNDLFGRPGVDAYRIVLLHKIMERIHENTESITNRPFATYGLTPFVILAAVKRLLCASDAGRELCRNPKQAFDDGHLECVLDVVNDLLKALMIDVNHEIESGSLPDYKSDLKSKTSVEKFLGELVRSYQKDRLRGKVDDIGDRLVACKITDSGTKKAA
ncbi:MAG: AIPR family protein [Phenylobacterium sp.]|uniref:AIPR family protein n=1 Tax=Phenylobacterium sp. TaxID=1871053 RepID=UPI0027267A39|nr:AIPR family protein [Phenylobacterium sp.]MDO9432927.1 AIPR family protein [Phenylobacterium sp.]